MRLQAEDYSEAQRTGALGSIFGVDPVLVEDGTYFVAEWEGRIVACGGWSERGTPFGSDRSPARDDRVLDPAYDAARIRAPGGVRAGGGGGRLQTPGTYRHTDGNKAVSRARFCPGGGNHHPAGQWRDARRHPDD